MEPASLYLSYLSLPHVYEMQDDKKIRGWIASQGRVENHAPTPQAPEKIGYFVILQHPQLPGGLRSAARRTPSGLSADP